MRRTFALAVAFALLLAACGPAAPTEEDPTPTPATTPEQTPEPTPDETPDETPEPTNDAAPPDDPAAAGLLELLPEEVDGLELDRQAASGAEWMLDADEEFMDVIGRLGRSPDDVTAATAFGIDMDDGRYLFIFAMRIAGADTDQLRQEFRQSIEDDPEEGIEFDEEVIDGRRVLTAFDAEDDFGGFIYVYAWNDVLFMITATDEELADITLRDLP